jgi:alkylation response protein AidB-like acyl-CoA dehydrogenase
MYSFEPTEEQQLILDTARDFASTRMRPHALSADERQALPNGFLSEAWDLGLAVGAIPEPYGGTGMTRSAVTGALLCEQLSHGDLAHTLAMLSPALVAYPLVDYGTDEQKARHLAGFTGKAVPRATAAVVEPSMDWDPSEMGTTAERQGNEYVLRGRKCFVPLGSTAETFLVYARTGGPGIDGVQAFLVPRPAKGLIVSEKERNMGICALDTVEVSLDEVRIRLDARLGGDKGIQFARIMS